jgi:hypothetical protein
VVYTLTVGDRRAADDAEDESLWLDDDEDFLSGPGG